MAKEDKGSSGAPPAATAQPAAPPQTVTLPPEIGFRPDQLKEMVERGQIDPKTRGAIETLQQVLADAGLKPEALANARYLYAGYLQRTGKTAGETLDTAAFVADFKKHLSTAKGGN